MKWVLLIILLLVVIALVFGLYRRTNAGSNQAQRRRAATPDIVGPGTAGQGGTGQGAAEQGADELIPGPEGEHRVSGPSDRPAPSSGSAQPAQQAWHPNETTSGDDPDPTRPTVR